MTLRRKLESAVQKEIIEFVEAVIPHGLIFAVPNGAKRTLGGHAANAVPGLYPGAPDLCLCLPKGRVIWIEVKAAKGQSSAAQIAFSGKLWALSHSYFVARSLDDCRRAFAALGVETREVIAS